MTEDEQYLEKIAELKNAIDNNDAKEINKLCIDIETSEVIDHFGIEAARFFYKHAMHNKERIENKYGINPTLQLLISEYQGEYQVVIDYIKIIREFHPVAEIKIYNEEVIRCMMKFNQAIEIIKACIDYNVQININNCFVLSAHIQNADLFHFIVDNFDIDKGIFELFLLYWFEGEYQYDNSYPELKISYANVIDRLINEFDFDVNLKDGTQFKYLVHECFYSHPFAVHLFFTDKFDSRLLEDEEFWEEFSEMLEADDVQYYLIAFQDIKASGIKFNDSIMLEALKSAGHDALIQAYLN